ncbi:MAG: class I SAM-dependent methyltransferase [Erysipelotrichaceae bacterium]|nr:class I SAM-dependent methyltransferase [Erysipelotrichaceae bacterium]
MLSNRLLEISKMVEKNKVVFDVGSDHAQLPCFLLKEGIVDKAYAGDIAEGPLNSAKKNIDKLHLEGKVIPVLSDGLNNAPDDVKQVIISGMGYYTIEHILDNCDIDKYDCFIIQSNTDNDLLRKYISDHGYTIMDENIIYDGFYYQIIKFNSLKHEAYTDLEIKYGPILLERRDKVFLEYLEKQVYKLNDIYVKSGNSEILSTINEIKNILY